jgi:hypothetical protein
MRTSFLSFHLQKQSKFRFARTRSCPLQPRDRRNAIDLTMVALDKVKFWREVLRDIPPDTHDKYMCILDNANGTNSTLNKHVR